MIKKYSDDKATQIVIALLKSHGIKKVVASPGTTNVALVAGFQIDNWFEVYSCVDERSAAYMACGLSVESGEPVVITCTGATASRNYYPGITEAFYRKLPILAITGFQSGEAKGHLYAQSLDRRVQPLDTFKMSVEVGKIADEQDEWKAIVDINAAILELKHKGGGPVHINLREATYGSFTTEVLPSIRIIKRYSINDNLPAFPAKRTAVFIGAHKKFSTDEIRAIDFFCEKYNAVVLTDHTGGYNGKFKVMYALPASQANIHQKLKVDLLIHLGEVSGDYYTLGKIQSGETWRINEDGVLRDKFKNLSAVFEMSELCFFTYYNNLRLENTDNNSIYQETLIAYQTLYENFPNVPFSNIWVAMKIHDKLPKNSVLHLGILNSLRAWNLFATDNSIETNCNVGGFGIDGVMSTLIGASLVDKSRLHFAVLGDLAFFYDLNSLGNRHVGNNLRILLINNGRGTEFRNYDHPASKWGNDADLFFAAGGHFGNQSTSLVKDYANNLGFKYLTASTKEEFLNKVNEFLIETPQQKSIVFEVFTNSDDESSALKQVRTIMDDDRCYAEKVVLFSKNMAKKVIKRIR